MVQRGALRPLERPAELFGAYELHRSPRRSPRLLSLTSTGDGALDGAWRWWGALPQGPSRWLLALWSPSSWPPVNAPLECLIIHRGGQGWRWRSLQSEEEQHAKRLSAPLPWSPAHPQGLIGRWQSTGSAGILSLLLAESGRATVTQHIRSTQAAHEETERATARETSEAERERAPALQNTFDRRQLYWWGDHQFVYLLPSKGASAVPLTLSWEAGATPQLRLPLPRSTAESQRALVKVLPESR